MTLLHVTFLNIQLTPPPPSTRRGSFLPPHWSPTPICRSNPPPDSKTQKNIKAEKGEKKSPPLWGQYRVKVVFVMRRYFISSFNVSVCCLPPRGLRLLLCVAKFPKVLQDTFFNLDLRTYKRVMIGGSQKMSNAKFHMCSCCFFRVLPVFLFVPPPYAACLPHPVSQPPHLSL